MGLHQSCAYFGLSQSTLSRREQGLSEVKAVLRKLQIEEPRFSLFKLAGGGQHIVRLPRRFGHRHIDDHAELERPQGMAHAVAVGHGMNRVAAFDKHRAETIRMVGQYLLGDHVIDRFGSF